QLESDIKNTINKTKDEYREMVGEEPPKTDYMQVEYKPKRYMVVSTILSMIFGSFGVLYASALGGAIAIGLMALVITLTVSATQDPLSFISVYFLLRLSYVVLAVYFTHKTNEKHKEEVQAINEGKVEAVRFRMEELREKYKERLKKGYCTEEQVNAEIESLIRRELTIERLT